MHLPRSGGLLLLLFLVSMPCLAAAADPPPASSPPSSSSSPAPGGFTPKGELPQLEFARLGAYRFASSSLCLRTKRACYVLCARKQQTASSTLREEGPDTPTTGSGIHLVSPGIGCLCQGQDGDVLAQVGLLRREAERYLHAFGHPITARLLAYRLGAILGGKGQETWSRPPCCISILMAAKDSGRGAEMYQVDPTGLVLSVRGQAFGGGQAEDPVAHDAQAWLADVVNDGDEQGQEEKKEEKEEEEDKAMWAKLWEGMQKHFPTLARHPERVECAKAAASRFTRLGTVDKVLGASTAR